MEIEQLGELLVAAAHHNTDLVAGAEADLEWVVGLNGFPVVEVAKIDDIWGLTAAY